MTTYLLTAECCGETVALPVTEFDSPAAAAAAVRQHDEDGTFPEGYDAVLTNTTTGEVMIFTDEWVPWC